MPIEKLADSLPLDQFGADANHASFQVWLEQHGRVIPNVNVDESEKPATTTENAPLPVLVKPNIYGQMIVVMGKDHDITLVYPQNSPLDVNVFGTSLSKKVRGVVRDLHIASVVAQDPKQRDIARGMARNMKVQATERLLELGRPDIISANRMLFREKPAVTVNAR